jgi:rhamnosyltransferase
MAKVVAVVVSYQPGDNLRRLAQALRGQVWRTCVVDNGSRGGHERQLEGLAGDEVHVMRLGRNHGLGFAHNRGIEWANQCGATHVLILDQDSLPAPAMTAQLLREEHALVQRGVPVGALGPVYHETNSGKTWPFYRLSRFGVVARGCDARAGAETSVACDFLISSGMLVRLSVLERAGAMDEGYFIEHVDTEWALRARHRGYALFGVCGAQMRHSLGDAAVEVPLMGRKVQLYAADRHYYLFRNAVLLSREGYAPLPWKLNELRRLSLWFVFFGLFVRPRRRRLRMMLKGIWHGLRGVRGPLRG